MSTVRSILKAIIAEWKDIGIPRDLIPRDYVIRPKKRWVTVITGARMTGKTYLMFQTMKRLMDEGVDENRIFYVNFEDERVYGDTAFLTELLPAIREEFGVSENIYLFLDEIHLIPKWDIWLRRNLMRELIITISGSTSELMPDRVASSLGGRTKTHIVYPLSFIEYLRFKGIDVKKSIEYSLRKYDILYHLKEYMLFGGLPEIVKTRDKYGKLRGLQEYFLAILHRDIIRRQNVDKPVDLEILYKLLADTTLFSASKTEKTMKSLGYKISKATILKYKNYGEKAYLIYQSEIFSTKIKDRLQYPRKIYFIDTGLRRAISTGWSINETRILENLVFIELLRRKKLTERIAYWRGKQRREVDFVIEENLKPKKLIQVCYDPTQEETRKREEKALIEAMRELGITHSQIITWDYEETKQINNKKITYIPLWKILLKQKTQQNTTP